MVNANLCHTAFHAFLDLVSRQDAENEESLQFEPADDLIHPLDHIPAPTVSSESNASGNRTTGPFEPAHGGPALSRAG
eukprot:753476-Hanusia_phi.AAC.5